MGFLFLVNLLLIVESNVSKLLPPGPVENRKQLEKNHKLKTLIFLYHAMNFLSSEIRNFKFDVFWGQNPHL